jgi:hypothetical protein
MGVIQLPIDLTHSLNAHQAIPLNAQVREARFPTPLLAPSTHPTLNRCHPTACKGF